MYMCFPHQMETNEVPENGTDQNIAESINETSIQSTEQGLNNKLTSIKQDSIDLGESMNSELNLSLGSSIGSLASSLNTSVSASRGKDSSNRGKSSRGKRKLDSSQQLSSSKKSKR